jgi:nicotinamidase-related amidase
MEIDGNCALILIDMQQGINHPRLGRRNNPQAESRISALLQAWRESGRPVIHVRHFSTSPDSVFWPGQSGVEYQPAFLPQGDERELSKHTPDAFCGSFLELWLRGDGIRQIAVVGVVTNNSVESTVRAGSNLGFEVVVAHDACFTFDQTDFFGTPRSAEDVHAMSLANLHGEYATVLSSADLLQQLQR